MELRRLWTHRKKEKILLARLRIIDKALQRTHSEFLVELDKQLRSELDTVLDQEESLWRQKARTKWILEGDRNTAFYHASTITKRRANKIETLKREDGSWSTDQEELREMAIQFYTKLFSSSGDPKYNYEIRGKFQKIEEHEKESLTREVTNEKIKEAIFGIGPLKALGIDGIHALFYQKNWSLVGNSVSMMIR
ncbi:uncharacterized protein LOC120198223 [Hibiscus syriacus]|uniref:uncharacterized protein LOC120198223 n=1 Tax=Hibiscus syriacus TaxID=106335 RepID=UPI0019242F38|nr:uncharacterized protein LOC120198223 [Hibiscus syriacus]